MYFAQAAPLIFFCDFISTSTLPLVKITDCGPLAEVPTYALVVPASSFSVALSLLASSATWLSVFLLQTLGRGCWLTLIATPPMVVALGNTGSLSGGLTRFQPPDALMAMICG